MQFLNNGELILTDKTEAFKYQMQLAKWYDLGYVNNTKAEDIIQFSMYKELRDEFKYYKEAANALGEDVRIADFLVLMKMYINDDGKIFRDTRNRKLYVPKK